MPSAPITGQCSQALKIIMMMMIIILTIIIIADHVLLKRTKYTQSKQTDARACVLVEC